MFQAHNSLGEVYHLQALQAEARGESPDAFFAQARAAYASALAQAPTHPTALTTLAWTDYFEGKFRVRAGQDPGDFLARAREGSRTAFETSGRSRALLCVASTHRLEAEWRLAQGDDAGARRAIAAARTHFEQLLARNPAHAEGHRSMGRLMTLEARRLRARGADPESALAEARRWLDAALEHVPDGGNYWLALARLELAVGDASARARGRDAVDRALALRPGWASAERVRTRFISHAPSSSIGA
ncbi:MAG: hypothetical protein AAF772_11365 [Acidobacteriota bacterium]